ncbi:hypothetical protein FRC03_003485 [Tulasnella sp. 419]|nr:hypothetical protein FRC03_003485 [Tulasnella sp. 419]
MNEAEKIIAREYLEIKSKFPDEGRRKWKLRSVDEFWKSAGAPSSKNPAEGAEAPWKSDADPFDLVDEDESGLVGLRGIVVRTDYSDPAAWGKFKEVLEQSEKEGFEELRAQVGDEDVQSGASGEAEDVEMKATPEDEEDSEDEPESIFHIIDMPPDQQGVLENASNLTLLRLFCDVVVIPEWKPVRKDDDGLFSSTKTKEKNTPWSKNRLAGLNGWKEGYEGRIIWVYDAQSNRDGSLRLIDGGLNGTSRSSTGDSWRVKGSRIWELQVNMDAGALRVDFGGEDGWTYEERRRNYEHVEAWLT